ncbi:MAG: hypothetical protein DMF15_13310 [Verrucomicrobia bacterium]|nr:MAG: hypothetical protein DMF15_13310 [Verrucomicrobiota bacterium]
MLFSLIRRILKTAVSVQFFFLLFLKYLRRRLYNCHNNIDANTAMLHAPYRQLASHKNRVYNEDGNCC